MSKDPDQEYICDGITETIITVLSHINNLLVFLKKAIRLNPIPPLDYLFDLGWAYRTSKQYDKAIETYEMCLKHRSDFWSAYIGLAISYQFLGREEESRAAVKEALEINPDYSIEHYKKGMPYKNKAELECNVEALRKAGVPE